MALIAVCLTVTFVICGRANEGSGGRGGARRGGGEEERRGEGMVWQVREGANRSVCARVHVCVSLADLLVRKQIFSLSDSINLPHLS